MRFDELGRWDRRVAVGNAAIAVVLLFGLLVSGAWLLIFEGPLATEVSVAMSVHDTLADLLAGLALWITAWVSYRVLFRLCRTGVATMVVIAIGIVTGRMIRVDALIRDGRPVEFEGYATVFGANYDYVAVGDRELSPAVAIAWNVVHLLSLPIAVAIVAVVLVSARRTKPDATGAG